MRFEQSLVLNRYFHGLFGARDLTELKQPLSVQEGRAADGQSYFYGALLGRVQDEALRDKLAEYDARVMGCEARLAKARGAFVFKYFQYLGLLYTEIFLDRLTTDPVAFRAGVNDFVQRQKRAEPSLHEFTAFEPDDLRRLAFFMATGSGKTLLLHVNLWQSLHYLRHGLHPEALVRRTDKRREFDSILLVTPNEGLSGQHLRELRLSGMDAVLLVEDRSAQRTFEPRVRVIEIRKLAEETSGEGVSVPLESLGSANLVFVDEGHKGNVTEERTFKKKQKALGRNGFIFEYRQLEVYLLRNLPKVGVGFFVHSGLPSTPVGSTKTGRRGRSSAERTEETMNEQTVTKIEPLPNQPWHGLLSRSPFRGRPFDKYVFMYVTAD